MMALSPSLKELQVGFKSDRLKHTNQRPNRGPPPKKKDLADSSRQPRFRVPPKLLRRQVDDNWTFLAYPSLFLVLNAYPGSGAIEYYL